MLHIGEDNLITTSKYKAYIFRKTDIKQSNIKYQYSNTHIFKWEYFKMYIMIFKVKVCMLCVSCPPNIQY